LALTTFLRYRTDIRLSAAMVRSLEALAARFPLIAISNGNADIAKMGIAHLFRASLRAGPDGKMKPSADLFQRAAAVLNIEPAHILHVGDHPVADVQGALHAGFSAAWLHQPVQPHPESCMADASDSLHAIEPQPIRHDAKLRQRLTLLPHLEIRDIAELTALV
jgi:putative hydrolase of the HAD superfamily